MAFNDASNSQNRVKSEQEWRRGSPGEVLLQFAGMIDKTDAEEMLAIIEEDCERIDPDEQTALD